MKFKITNLRHFAETGQVFMVDWEATSEKNGVVAKTSGCQILTTKEPSASDFVKIEKLTEAMVIDWIKAEMGDAYLANLDAELTAQLNSSSVPSVSASLPWAN